METCLLYRPKRIFYVSKVFNFSMWYICGFCFLNFFTYMKLHKMLMYSYIQRLKVFFNGRDILQWLFYIYISTLKYKSKIYSILFYLEWKTCLLYNLQLFLLYINFFFYKKGATIWVYFVNLLYVYEALELQQIAVNKNIVVLVL